MRSAGVFCFSVLLFWSLHTTVALGQTTPEQDVRKLFSEQFTTYWQLADAEGLASLWHEDGDWMSITGSRRIRKGRAQIAQVWSVGLRGRTTDEQRMLNLEIDAIQLLTPRLAQVDMVMVFGHAHTGIVREAMVALLEKEGATWKIRSSRVARISATPAQP